MLVAAGYWDGSVKLFDLATGKEGHTFKDAAGVNAVAFSVDSKTLASGGPGGQIKLWDMEGRKERRSLATGARDTLSLAYSIDGKWLASAHQDGWVIVWDAANGTKKDSWQLPGAVNALAFAVDSRHLITGNANSTVYVFRLTEYKKKLTKPPTDTERD
jgi:WD40 repeat protein